MLGIAVTSCQPRPTFLPGTARTDHLLTAARKRGSPAVLWAWTPAPAAGLAQGHLRPPWVRPEAGSKPSAWPRQPLSWHAAFPHVHLSFSFLVDKSSERRPVVKSPHSASTTPCLCRPPSPSPSPKPASLAGAVGPACSDAGGPRALWLQEVDRREETCVAPVSQAFPLMPHSIIPAALRGQWQHARSVDAEACKGIIQGHQSESRAGAGTWVFLACRASFFLLLLARCQLGIGRGLLDIYV